MFLSKNFFKIALIALIISVLPHKNAQAVFDPRIGIDLPKIPYVMLDYENGDWQGQNPQIGPVGVWWQFDVNKGPVPPMTSLEVPISEIESYLRKGINHKITLEDGRQLPKPVGVGVNFYLPNWQDYANNGQYFWDYVKKSQAAIQELGQRLNNNPEFNSVLKFVIIGGPCQIAGEITGGCPGWAVGTNINRGVSKTVMEVASEAFPNKYVIFQGTEGTVGQLSDEAVRIPRKNIIIKANGWGINTQNAYNRLTYGILGFLDFFGDKIPVGLEPYRGPINIAEPYFLFLGGLSHHPDFLDIQRNYLFTPTSDALSFEAQTGFPLLKFLRDHIGVTITNTPDVWAILRETKATAPDPQSPDTGNYEFWLYEKRNAPGSATVVVPNPCVGAEGSFGKPCLAEVPEPAKSHPYSYENVRRTNGPDNPFMSFDIDDRFVSRFDPNESWNIKVVFANYGSDTLSLEYKDKVGLITSLKIRKGPSLGQVNQWVEYVFELNDAQFSNGLGGADFRINSERDGDEYIHRVIVAPSCPSKKLGNLNCDGLGLINEQDLNILLKQWGRSGIGDLDGSGRVDANDLQILLNNWKI